MNDPAPGIYLQYIPEWLVRRIDQLYGEMQSGSITVHLHDGEAKKIERKQVESAQAVRRK